MKDKTFLFVLFVCLFGLIVSKKYKIDQNTLLKKYYHLSYKETHITEKYNSFLINQINDESSELNIQIETPFKTFLLCLKLNAEYKNQGLHLLEGKLCDEDDSHVLGEISYGKFYGDIYDVDEHYIFEQTHSHSINHPKNAHTVLYNFKDYNSTKLSQVIRRIQNHPIPLDKEFFYKLSKRSRIQSQSDSNSENSYCSVKVEIDQSYIDQGFTVNSAALHAISMYTYANKIFATYFKHLDGKPRLIYKVVSFGLYQGNDLTEFIGVPDKLVTEYNKTPSKTCAKLLMVSKNWDGVLGMAMVGTPRGDGICDKNHGIIVTNVTPSGKSGLGSLQLTMTHELGHGNGAFHDPTSACKSNCRFMDQLAECSPGEHGGNYIMFPTLGEGQGPNNNRFSACSVQQISAIISVQERIECLQNANVGFCGNKILDTGEECDVGEDDDDCCYGSKNTVTPCKLKTGKNCSPQNSNCCSSSCTFLGANQECSKETDCKKAGKCSGNSAVCSEGENKDDKTYCNLDTKVCVNGTCTGSICSINNHTGCSCDGINSCSVCCMNKNKCTLFEPIKKYPLGTACEKGSGYCQADGSCKIASNGAVFTLFQKIFTGSIFNDIFNTIQENMFYIVGGAVGFIFVATVLCVMIDKKFKNTEY